MTYEELKAKVFERTTGEKLLVASSITHKIQELCDNWETNNYNFREDESRQMFSVDEILYTELWNMNPRCIRSIYHKGKKKEPVKRELCNWEQHSKLLRNIKSSHDQTSPQKIENEGENIEKKQLRSLSSYRERVDNKRKMII